MVGVAGVAVEVIRAWVPGAGTGPAVIPRTQDWVAEEPVHTPAIKETEKERERDRERERF